MRSAYEILGVEPDATAAEIRRVYRVLVKAHHPDLRPEDPAAHERFLVIKAAYEVLIDPVRRAAHDAAPATTVDAQLLEERRQAQLRRRKKRLWRLYE